MVTETTCDLGVCILVTRDGKGFSFLQRWLKVGRDFNAAAHVIKDLKLSYFILLKHWELFRCFTSSHYFQVLDVCTCFLCRSASLQLSSVSGLLLLRTSEAGFAHCNQSRNWFTERLLELLQFRGSFEASGDFQRNVISLVDRSGWWLLISVQIFSVFRWDLVSF